MTAAFDTLKLAEKLESAGFTSQQARGAAAALSEAFTADLTTKADLLQVELRLEAKLSDVKADILKWVVGAIGLQTVAFILLKVFGH